MSGNCDIHYSLICAVREGKLERVRELISDFGLSYSQAWSEGYVLLRNALENKRTSVAKLLLTSGAKVNRKNKAQNCTPLHYAVKNGDIEIVEMLLDRYADINAKGHNGETPLCYAIEYNEVEIFELLLNRHAYVNDVAITSAIRSGHLHIVKRLLEDFIGTYRADYTALRLAIEKGNEDIIKLLLNTGADVDDKGMDGGTCLHIAARMIYFNIVELLLKHGTCVNSVYTSTFREGYTPLWFAVEFGHEKNVELLLKYGANADTQNKDGKTIIYLAVEKTHKKIVELLLKHGANADAQNKDGKSILHLAVEKECLVVIEHILKYCPDVNNDSNKSALVAAVHSHEKGQIVNKLLQYGFTLKPEDANDSKLLHAAVQKGYLKIVEELLKFSNGAAISEKGYNTALHVATKHRQEEVAKLLISYGADVNVQDANENTPIFYATENGDIKMIKLLLTNGADIKENRKLLPIAVKVECREVVEVLLEHGADVNTSDQYGRTALHLTALNRRLLEFCPIIMPYKSKNPDSNVKGKIAKLLLGKGANANAQTKKGLMVLHAATQSGYVNVVEALLEYNADVNATMTTDITPLHISAQEGNEVISKMLLSKGANINAKLKDNRMTALHMAVHKGHEKVVEVLLRCGAKVDFRIKFDVTPLQIAAQKGYKKIIEALLKFGADIDSKNTSGKTALHIASKEGYSGVVRALLVNGADINIETKRYDTPLNYANAGITSFYNRFNYSDDEDNYYNFGERGICGCEEVAEILQDHIVKIKTANLYVSERNLRSISGNYENSYVQNKYKKEIASMKIEKIDNTNVSFYDILTKGVNRLAIYLLNENIIQVFRSNGYKTKFPLYASMLEINFTKGKIRKSLLEQSNTLFQVFSSNLPKLPYNCTENIFSYLSDKDLKMLLEAFRNGEGRKELLEQGYQFFHFVFNNYPEFSYDFTENIFSYLSNEDLRILIQACKPSCNV